MTTLFRVTKGFVKQLSVSSKIYGTQDNSKVATSSTALHLSSSPSPQCQAASQTPDFDMGQFIENIKLPLGSKAFSKDRCHSLLHTSSTLAALSTSV